MAEEPKQAPMASPGDAPGKAQPALDLAGESLANALRMSFRILTFIIAILVLTFLASGIFNVHEDEVAVILRFGKTNSGRVKEDGLRYAFPYPFDKVVRISTKPRSLDVNAFWPTVSEVERMKAIETDRQLEVAVVEGAEGHYVLTGDLNILQSRWSVDYQIRRALGKVDKSSVIKYYTKIGLDEASRPEDEKRYEKTRMLIKELLESAVIEEIGGLGVFEAYPGGAVLLTERVARNMENVLDKQLDCGIEITSVKLKGLLPPAAVKADFDMVSEAETQSHTLVTNAESVCNNEMISVAGELGPTIRDDLGRWWDAHRKGDVDEMQRIEKIISGHFQSEKLGGKARKIITEAKAYRKNIVTRTQGEADRLKLLAERSPRERAVLLDRLRIEALENMMETSYEKFMYRPIQNGTNGTLELWMDRRPELLRELRKVEETR